MDGGLVCDDLMGRLSVALTTTHTHTHKMQWDAHSLYGSPIEVCPSVMPSTHPLSVPHCLIHTHQLSALCVGMDHRLRRPPPRLPPLDGRGRLRPQNVGLAVPRPAPRVERHAKPWGRGDESAGVFWGGGRGGDLVLRLGQLRRRVSEEGMGMVGCRFVVFGSSHT